MHVDRFGAECFVESRHDEEQRRSAVTEEQRSIRLNRRLRAVGGHSPQAPRAPQYPGLLFGRSIEHGRRAPARFRPPSSPTMRIRERAGERECAVLGGLN